MKIAHLSDLHYCGKHLEHVDKAVHFAIQHAIAAGAEAFIFSGDEFDAEVPLHHPAVGALLRQVQAASNHAPVLILQGTYSHDRPGCLDVFKHVRGAHPVCVADRIAQAVLYKGFDKRPDGVGTFTGWTGPTAGQWVDFLDADALRSELNAHGDSIALVVSVLPSINRAAVQAQSPDAKTADLVADLCRAWSGTHNVARARGIPTVVVSHGTVNGCLTESKQAMVSPDHEFSTGTLFSADADAVMLGHIHLHQGWSHGGQRIAYPGSITKLIYGHAGDNGYLLWNVQPGRADYELVRTPERRLISIEYPGPPDLADLRARLADCRDAYVRLRWTVDEEHRHTVDVAAIKSLLEAAGVAGYKIEPHVNPVQRSRAAGIHQAASLPDKLTRWCELTGTDPSPLLPRLAQLEAGQQPRSPV